MEDTTQKAVGNSDIEILKLLFDEWQFRVKNHWSLIIKFNLLSLTLILIPVMNEEMLNLEVFGIPILVLPFAGVFFAGIICCYSRKEKKELATMKECMNKYVAKIPQFQDVYANSSEKYYQQLPLIIFALQVTLAIIIYIGTLL